MEGERESSGLIGKATNAVAAVIATGVLIAQKAMGDGYLGASARQGLGELGEILKAFPDSIQHDEPGTVWNPLPSEIAAGREDAHYGNWQPSFTHGRSPSPEQAPSPGQIAHGLHVESGQERDTEHDGGPSPSDIARGTEIAQSWVERVNAERAKAGNGNDGSPAKERTLPIEQKELGRGR
jgi:hypothetical protein